MKTRTWMAGCLMMSCMTMTTATAKSAKTNQQGYPITQVPFTDVKIAPNTFWGNRIKAAREVTIPLAFSKCKSEGRYSNFEKAAYTLQHPNHAGLNTDEYDVSKFMGFPFDDTDVYKTIEGASYVLQTYPDKRLKAYIDSVLNIVGAAQEPDGYLYTARTINPNKPHGWSGNQRWTKEEELSHELYDLGHMVDAACAHYQATGSKKFLNIARRYADCVVREVGSKGSQAKVVPGHQIAEMALARLYVLTGEKSYLDEAIFFLDNRGKTSIKNPYSQSHITVTEQKEAVGHAVRAGYMYAGMADVAALTGDSSYIKAIDAIWNNIVSKKYYLTGGVGARHGGEAYGDNYELPNLTAYNETCAAIAMVYLNYRMFLLHGESKYIDCLERTLYNGVIDGMSIDGGKFFYPNPLAADGKYAFNADNTKERQPWFGCACCPSNLCRFIPSFPGYMYAVKDDRLYVNLYAGNTATIPVEGKEVTLEQTTQYPWNGDIAIKVTNTSAKQFKLMVRIPGWVKGEVVPSDLYSYADGKKLDYTITVNGNAVDTNSLQDGYAMIERDWKKGDVVKVHFDMQPRMVKANRKVADDRGRVAIERGPLVYCAEFADNQADLFHLIANPKAAMQVVNAPNIVGGIQEIKTEATALTNEEDGSVSAKKISLTLIPYYAWNHRGIGQMEVWIPASLDVMGK